METGPESEQAIAAGAATQEILGIMAADGNGNGHVEANGNGQAPELTEGDIALKAAAAYREAYDAAPTYESADTAPWYVLAHTSPQELDRAIRMTRGAAGAKAQQAVYDKHRSPTT